MSLFDQIFPVTASNEYNGNPVVLWIFGILTLISVGRSLIHIFKFDGGAQSIATIPLDTYPPNASNTIVRFCIKL